MTKAIVDIDKRANKIISLLKAEFDLRDKSQAINKMAEQLETFIDFEPRVRPEYAGKLLSDRKQPPIRVGSISDFKKRYGAK